MWSPQRYTMLHSVTVEKIKLRYISLERVRKLFQMFMDSIEPQLRKVANLPKFLQGHSSSSSGKLKEKKEKKKKWKL